MQDKSIPWLWKRGRHYYAVWYDPAERRNRRLSLGTTDPREAQARFAAFLTSAGETIRGEDAPALTCDVVLDDYWQEYARDALADAAMQKTRIEHLKAHFAGVPVRDVNQAIVARYLARRAAGEIGKPSKSPTHRRELNVLVAAIARKVRQRALASTDVPHIELPANSQPRSRWLTEAELARLLTAARDDERLRLFILLAYYTASRRDALEKLTWFQVDLDRERIRLDLPGAKATKKRRPTVPISPVLLPALKRAHAERTTEYVLERTTDMYWPFKQAVARAGLSGVSPHTLRHTRATHLAQAGVSLYAIAGLLGDTIKTVEENYLTHCPDHLSEVLAADQEICL